MEGVLRFASRQDKALHCDNGVELHAISYIYEHQLIRQDHHYESHDATLLIVLLFGNSHIYSTFVSPDFELHGQRIDLFSRTC